MEITKTVAKSIFNEVKSRLELDIPENDIIDAVQELLKVITRSN